MKLLHLHPSMITGSQTQRRRSRSRAEFLDSYLYGMPDRQMERVSTHSFHLLMVCLRLSGQRNLKITDIGIQKIWLINEMRLQDVGVGVWCAISATRIIAYFYFSETTNSPRYVTQVLIPPFWKRAQLRENVRPCSGRQYRISNHKSRPAPPLTL